MNKYNECGCMWRKHDSWPKGYIFNEEDLLNKAFYEFVECKNDYARCDRRKLLNPAVDTKPKKISKSDV